MIDRQVSISLSVPCALAWGAWAVMTALLATGWVTQEVIWGILALAASAVAATLHMRCFMIRLHQNIRGAYELGRETERVTQLRSTR